MILRATYRLQFHKHFTFDDAAGLAPYLARLGISHVYVSPILHARAGSKHGYDVVDHRRINPELGGEDAFRRMANGLRGHGLGIVLDIVPNHMAVGGADNPWWLDVLEKGPASPFAHYFDIDWNPPSAALRNKVLAPFLGAPYREALDAGEVALLWDATLGRLAFAYHEHRFPLRAEDHAEVCGEAAPQDADLSGFQTPEALHALLERQNFRLAWWRTAGDQINWRRFFTINELAALRVEDERVFEAVHDKILELYAEGLIDGVRVDHVDGLTYPGRYLRHLRARLEACATSRPRIAQREAPYIVVEKILASDETLPPDWPVAGTTGYDFMNEVSAIAHDAAGAAPLARLWARTSLRPAAFAAEERLARRQTLLGDFEGPLDAAANAFQELMPGAIAAHDATAPALRRALIAVIEEFRAYRTYATGDETSSPPGTHFEAAIRAAKASAVPVDAMAIDYLAQIIGGDGPPSPQREHAARLFNQLAAPVAAKAVEDTAFYRYGRLLSRNDVGFDPDQFSLNREDFHARTRARALTQPAGLLATATHDHKRGEDTRARLAVLSEIPRQWASAIAGWFKRNAALRTPLLDNGDLYQLYQTLVGAWPMDLRADDEAGLGRFAERIVTWREKSLREAKLQTSWADPNEPFEAANRDFVRAALDPERSGAFLGELAAFVARIAPAGALNGLVQTVLRCTAPGVPDLYQGTEFWDLSLVDPDNRRAVDFAARAEALQSAETLSACLRHWHDGHVKQAAIATLLMLRDETPDLFAHGSYEPLRTRGPRAKHVLAFVRRHAGKALLVAIPRLCAAPCMEAGTPMPPAAFWHGTGIDMRGAETWHDVLTDAERGTLDCEALFAAFPAAVLRAG
jgi:(1->4)-alpha-D-glucan 1-alpha-D-glucosylmutase